MNNLKGKHIVIVVENLPVPFDRRVWQEANTLKENGARVIYGHQDIKVHSKLMQIARISNRQEQLITYVGTGNFNEKTAEVYGDLSLLTANISISREVKKVFRLLENHFDKTDFKHLMVSPFNTRSKLMSLINNEIRIAKKTKNGLIRLKINNLVDVRIIDKLYEASQAGVKIQLLTILSDM